MTQLEPVVFLLDVDETPSFQQQLTDEQTSVRANSWHRSKELRYEHDGHLPGLNGQTTNTGCAFRSTSGRET